MNKIILLILVQCLTACSSLQIKEKAKFHQISANTNGNYLSLYENNEHRQCGLNFHLESILQHINEQPVDIDTGKKKILISIHGGLNSIDANINRVEKHYEDAINDGFYPIFIGWRSGAITTLSDRYFGVRNGVDRSLWVTIPSAPFYLTSDLLRGVASIPESIWDQGSNFSTTHINRITGFTEEDIRTRLYDAKDINFIYTGRGNEKSFAEQVGYATRQVIPGVLRLATTPLIEGVANKSWGMMQRRAKTLIYRQGDLSYRGIGKSYSAKNTFPSNCESEAQYLKHNNANGVVAQLMRAIRSIDNVEIMLVGHSMGAIIANDIVNEFNDLNYRTIIHMASADSLRSLIDKTIPYLDRNPEANFYNLMLHPTNEEQEQSALGAAPEGSLLIWLDYILTEPETSLDRVAGRWDNMKWALPLFNDNQNMHFKMFGLRNQFKYEDNKVVHEDLMEPQLHSDFGDFKFWRKEFYWQKNRL